MISRNAREAFAVRYYHWALSEWEREHGDDYRWLMSIDNTQARETVEFLRSLKDDALLLAAALTRRFHRRACKLLAVEPTVVEADLLRRKDAFVARRIADTTHLSVAADASPVGRVRLRTLLKERLKSLLGAPVKSRASEALRYELLVPPFRVLTTIETSGRSHQMVYDHSIIGSIGDHDVIAEGISRLSWLGISGQTHWTTLHAGREEAAASSLVEGVQRFIESVPGLLSDLR